CAAHEQQVQVIEASQPGAAIEPEGADFIAGPAGYVWRIEYGLSHQGGDSWQALTIAFNAEGAVCTYCKLDRRFHTAPIGMGRGKLWREQQGTHDRAHIVSTLHVGIHERLQIIRRGIFIDEEGKEFAGE